jgi:hypothetical protein
MDLTPMIKRTIEHMIMSDTHIDVITNGYDLDLVLSTVKKIATSSAKGYKYNILRSKSKKIHQQLLYKHYPMEKYPEKWI